MFCHGERSGGGSVRERHVGHGLSGRAGNANKTTIAKPALDQDKVVIILGK